MADFKHLTALPLEPGDRITAMTVWKALGKDCIVVATRDKMYVLRISGGGSVDFAGPLEFAMMEETGNG